LFYQDLKFCGKIKVKTGNGFFWMIADGGSIENEIFWKGLDKWIFRAKKTTYSALNWATKNEFFIEVFSLLFFIITNIVYFII
jgi:hypothetical protein